MLSALVAGASQASSPAAGAQAALLADVQLQTQSLAKAILLIDRGDMAAWAQLSPARSRLSAELNLLQAGGKLGSCKLPAPKAAAQQALRPMLDAISALDKAAATIESNKAAQNAIVAAVKTISDGSEAMSALLQSLTDNDAAAPATLKTLVGLDMLRVRMSLSAERMLQSGAPSPEDAFNLGKDANTFGTALKALIADSEAAKPGALNAQSRAKALELAKTFFAMESATSALLQQLQGMIAYKMAVESALASSGQVVAAGQKLAVSAPSGTGCSVN
jgi:hypothetical protein